MTGGQRVLTIFVTMSESVDENTNEFVYQLFRLELEHSLASLSKWESKFAKPFLAAGQKTSEEVGYYVECMAIDPDVPPEVFQKLSRENAEEIMKYIDSKQTATWFSDDKVQTKSQEIITAEIIYYWLTSLRIPWEAQYWHLNRLLTLIRVFDLKQTKPKKMSKNEQLQRQRELNAKRKRDLGTNG
jgi:hypothetical protein